MMDCSTAMSNILRIHFAGLRDGAPSIPLARVCGAESCPQRVAADRVRFKDLYEAAPNCWRAVGLDEAQLVVYPHNYANNAETAGIAELARARGLPCLFFDCTDDATPATPAYGLVYRNSIFSDRLTPMERAKPAFADDLLADNHGQLPLRQKQERPVVGFCGFVGTAFNRLLYQLTGRTEKVRGLMLRHRALKALSRHPRVTCNFVRRSQFWAGAVGRFKQNAQQRTAVRQEFVQNVFGSDYTLCLRGKGNFSYRFYEVLAAGRIPLFINTRCVLPFADKIDWRKHCVWVEESNLDRTGQILADFHASLSPEQFQNMQRQNRALWERFLRSSDFYRQILDEVMTASPAGALRESRV